MRFQYAILKMRERCGETASQIHQQLHSLVAKRILLRSMEQQLGRILQIAERRAWFHKWLPAEDVNAIIDRLQTPRRSIITAVSEYTARGSAAFAPAHERATTHGGEASYRRFWLGPDSTDLVLRGTLKPLEDGHALDLGNKRLTNILENNRRGMVERLTRNGPFAGSHVESRNCARVCRHRF